MTNINQTSTIKIVPKCLRADHELIYSATGYILPCCYADNHNIEDFKNLMKEDLSLNNINDIDKNIINSKEWKDFFKLLLESPESAPRSCKYYCSSNWSTKNMIG
jgi:hypothetical protein